MISVDDALRPKPYPAAINENLLKRSGKYKYEILYIGDSRGDM